MTEFSKIELKRKLEEAKKEIEYYKKIAEQSGNFYLREMEALSKLLDWRKQAEEALQKAHDNLEYRVKKRTKELENKTKRLEEINTALNVMLQKREEDKLELEKKVMFNVKELIEPLINNLKNSGLDQNQTGYLDVLESFLNEIISPFSRTLYAKYRHLTPSEIRVANLVREGKSTKEIAVLLNSSQRAVEFHRNNLRKKLGFKNRKANLKSYLLSLP